MTAAAVPAAARLDARRMLCEQAVLAAMRAIRAVPPGGRLEVLTTAESVRLELRLWAERVGHAGDGEAPGEGPGEVVVRLRKRERPAPEQAGAR